MDLGLKGKRALITGGTRGIGRAIAEQLADEDVHIAICARRADEVRQAVAALKARGVSAMGAALDVSDGPALKAWIKAAAHELGGLDILVANASALAAAAREEDWRQSVSIDLMGTVNTVEGGMPFLERSDAASIVIIATVSAVETSRDFGVDPYGSIKAAILHYAKSLANAVAPKRIRVNAVSPGATYIADGFWGRIERESPGMFSAVVQSIPAGRMGRPDEIANAVAFLASPRASYITGTNLTVDGGITSRVQF